MNINSSFDDTDKAIDPESKDSKPELKRKSVLMQKSARLLLESLDDKEKKPDDYHDSVTNKMNKNKRCLCCYEIANMGEGKYRICPFRMELPNFSTFNGRTIFVDKRIIILSVVYTILVMSYGFNQLFEFGKISTFRKDSRRNKGKNDKEIA